RPVGAGVRPPGPGEAGDQGGRDQAGQPAAYRPAAGAPPGGADDLANQSEQARPSSVDCFSTLARAVPRMRGSVSTIVNSENASIGTTTTTHSVTTAR